MVETIDMTPTWEQILPTWVRLYKAAIRGETNDDAGIIANAEKELLRMARAADLWNATGV